MKLTYLYYFCDKISNYILKLGREIFWVKRLWYLVRFDEFAAVKLNMLIFLFSYLTWFHVIV